METAVDALILSPAVLRLTGVGLILLALVHVAFPRYFHWKEELARLSTINREMFLVHTLFVSFTVLIMGAVMAGAPEILLERSRLGAWTAAGFTLFWGLRLVIQWFGYSRQLWRGRRFETFIHFLFTGVWLWLTCIGWTLWRHQLN